MRRSRCGLVCDHRPVLVLALGVKIHVHFRHFHGSPLDYSALALGAFASWVGVPGPGEPLLIAGGILAAKHKLDLTEVVLIAWAGAAVGGVGGWALGLKAGRRVMTTRGPLHAMRQKALARGEEVFNRWPVAAILLTPAWVAGIHRVGIRVYLIWNAVGALLWAGGIGIGAYFAGPPIVDLVDDLGFVTVAGVVLLLAAGVGLEYTRRRRQAA
jgi:membrane protein DedA with SNARE-associated domain